MNKLNSLLVLPPMYQSGRISDYNPKEPMGLMYIASKLRGEGLSTEILDADILSLTLDETIQEIKSRKAKIVGFSVMQRALPSVKLITEGLRRQGINAHICCGGFSATLSAKYILEKVPEIDSIVLGEGEQIFLSLVQAIKSGYDWHQIAGLAYWENGQVNINQPSIKEDIDSLAWPIRDLLPIC